MHALLKRVGRLEEPLARIYLAEMVLGLQVLATNYYSLCVEDLHCTD